MNFEDQELLDAAVCAVFEAKPEPVALSKLRKGRDWQYNYCDVTSPGGWWVANIGYDAGDPPEVCDWRPRDLSENWEMVGEVLEAVRKRGHTAKIWMAQDCWRVSIAHGANAMSVDDELPLAVCKAVAQLGDRPGGDAGGGGARK